MFRYQPLDNPESEIRLIRYQQSPSSVDHERKDFYAIEPFDAATAPPYIALSYCWGPPTPVHSIEIGAKGFHLEIRDNLFQCLQILKTSTQPASDSDSEPDSSSSRTPYLWIDQICIDQANIPERNAQVSQMSHIYSNAQEVLVWLGPGDDDTNQAMAFIASDTAACESAPDETKRQARKLLTNPYWSRLWVAQEILLSKQLTLLCGLRRLSWTRWSAFWPEMACVTVPFLSALGAVFHTNASQDDFHASSAAHTFLWGRGSSASTFRLLPIWNHLASFSNSKCQEPRDKVFGLLGFADEEVRGMIEVDYAKPVVEVFVDAVNVALETTPRIQLSGGDDPEFYAEMLYLGMAMGVITTGEQVVAVANYFGRGLGRLLTAFGVYKALGVVPTDVSGFSERCLGHLNKLHGAVTEGNVAIILGSVRSLREKIR